MSMLAPTFLQLRTVRIQESQELNQDLGSLGFLFPRDGRGSHASSAGRLVLGAGDVLVVSAPKGQLLVPPGDGLEFSFFVLRPDHLLPLFDSGEISRLAAMVEGLKGAKVYPAASPLARECHQLLAGTPREFNLDHRTHLLRVAAMVFSHEFARMRLESGGLPRLKEHRLQLLEQLSTDELLNLSANELAGKLGCCRRHLNRLYHEYFGISLAALKMEMRLLKAASLLRNHDSKVFRVAEECGFNQMGRFNACFKRRFGSPPGRWRKLGAPLDGPWPGALHSLANGASAVKPAPPSAPVSPSPGISREPRKSNIDIMSGSLAG